MYHQF